MARKESVKKFEHPRIGPHEFLSSSKIAAHHAWYVDFGSNFHICNDIALFSEKPTKSQRPARVRIGDRSIIEADYCGGI